MAYTSVWSDTTPTGAEAANTIDDIFRGLKVDIEQRFIDIFGTMPNFTADPLRPYGLKFADAQDSVISLGDNAGTPRSLIVKNKAGSSTYFTFASTGLTIAGTLTPVGGINVTLSSVTTGGAVVSNIANATTSNLFFSLTNTSGSLVSGIESSVGGTLFTGTSAYSTVYGTAAAKSLHFATNNIVRATIDSSGLLTLLQGLTVSSGTSAFQAVTVTSITATADINTAAAANIYWSARSIMKSPADGVITFTNFGGSDFTRLQFGGTTNAFPALVRVGAGLAVYDATQGGLSTFGASVITASAGLTVSAGTSALQAVTGTTGVFSSTLSATVTTVSRLLASADLSTAVAKGVFTDGTTILANETPGTLGQLISVGNTAAGTFIAQLVSIKQTLAAVGTYFGARIYASASHGSGTVTALVGCDGAIYSDGSGGTTTRASALNASATNVAGTITDLRMIHAGTIVNTGTITNAYGLLIDAVTAGGTLNYAIKTLGGRINFTGLPTSSAGLASGDIWANSNTLQVIP